MAMHSPMMVVISASQMPACEQSRIGSRVFGDGAEDGDHAEHGSEEPEQGRDDGNEFDPAQAFRDTGEVPVEEVGDFRPDVFGVFAVCLRDVAYDADEWVVAGVDDIVPVSCGTLLHIQEIPLEFPPDELEKEQCAQGEEQADAGDQAPARPLRGRWPRKCRKDSCRQLLRPDGKGKETFLRAGAIRVIRMSGRFFQAGLAFRGVMG